MENIPTEWVSVNKYRTSSKEDNIISINKTYLLFSKNLREYLKYLFVKIYKSSDGNFIAFEPSENEGYKLNDKYKGLANVGSIKKLNFLVGKYGAVWDADQKMVILNLGDKK